jgi:hypothetical protein
MRWTVVNLKNEAAVSASGMTKIYPIIGTTIIDLA